MSQPNEHVIRQLHLWTDIPEEELGTLTPEQAANCRRAFLDKKRQLITVEDAVDRLKENGFFDLPSQREQLDHYLEECAVAEVRAMTDLYNAQCLQQGRPEDMQRIAKEDGAYPPARSN